MQVLANAARWSAVAAAAFLAGCASGMTSMAPGPLGYQHSNAMMMTGFSETAIADDHYRIEVTGYANTSRERLEKIAAARAAEIGRDNRLGYFKINGVEQSSRCQKFVSSSQKSSAGGGIERHVPMAVLVADVTFAKHPPDTSYIEAKTAFDQYRAELDADTVPPPPLESVAQCS